MEGSWKEKSPRKQSREKVSKLFDHNWLRYFLGGDKGSCFELLALDEEDVRYSLSITLLALSPFEAVTVTVSRGFPVRCLRVRSFVVYSMSKLRLL